MKSYVAPEFVFDRAPNKLDRAARFGKSVLALTQAVIERPEHKSKSELRMHEADESLRGYGFGFTERWRKILGDRLNNGVLLRTAALPYAIEAKITKDDTLPKLPEIETQYETNMDITVKQSTGHSTRMRVGTRTIHPEPDVVYPERVIPMVFTSHVIPLREDGRINSDNWGMYTFKEDAQLSEAALRIMKELDTASVTPGALEIIDL